MFWVFAVVEVVTGLKPSIVHFGNRVTKHKNGECDETIEMAEISSFECDRLHVVGIGVLGGGQFESCFTRDAQLGQAAV